MDDKTAIEFDLEGQELSLVELIDALPEGGISTVFVGDPDYNDFAKAVELYLLENGLPLVLNIEQLNLSAFRFRSATNKIIHIQADENRGGGLCEVKGVLIGKNFHGVKGSAFGALSVEMVGL
jgi:hypothetical protein